MTKLARGLTALAAALLLVLFATPLWRIDLLAPQYPEGLGMLIRVNTVTGVKPNDLENINGLNHYIGMKRIEPASIPVLRVMPWVVGALAASGLLVAFLGRRKALVAWAVLLVAAGAAGLAEFWYWQYDYGHHLSPDAIIKVPGMSYQPPLIGSKQLLNFTATSWPSVGGWAAFLAFALVAAALWVAYRRGGGTREAARVRAATPLGAPMQPARA